MSFVEIRSRSIFLPSTNRVGFLLCLYYFELFLSELYFLLFPIDFIQSAYCMHGSLMGDYGLYIGRCCGVLGTLVATSQELYISRI
jgi:hypothetical protein